MDATPSIRNIKSRSSLLILFFHHQSSNNVSIVLLHGQFKLSRILGYTEMYYGV